MADEIVRSLVTNLVLGAESFNNDLKAAQKEIKAFEKAWEPSLKAMKDVGIGMAALGTAITGSMLLATKKAVDFGDSLNDLRQKTGVSVENLSKLGFAAEQSGSSLEGVSTGMKFLAKNMEAAIAKGGDQRKAFNELGISSKDLAAANGDVNKVFLLLADRFKQLPDGAEKSALSMRVFGKAGADLIPVLNEGSAGIQHMGDVASATGNVMTQEFATASDKMNESVAALEASVGGVALQIATALLPTIQKIVDTLIPAVQWVSSFIKENQGLTLAVAAAGAAMAVAGTALVSIAVVIPQVVAGWGLLTTAFAAVGVTLTAATAGVAALGAAIGVGIGLVANYIIKITGLQDSLDKFTTRALKTLGFEWGATSEAQKSAAFTAAAVAKVQKEGLPVQKDLTAAVKIHKVTTDEDATALKKHADEAAKDKKELADLTSKVRENSDSLAAHKGYLASVTINSNQLMIASQGLRDALINQAIAASDAAADTDMLDVAIKKALGSTDIATASQKQATAAISDMNDKNATALEYHDKLSAAAINQAKAQADLSKAVNEIKDSAGKIFDDMFIKGENVFTSLKDALKGGALSLGRAIFEDITGALLGPIKKAFNDFFQEHVVGALNSVFGGVFGGSTSAAGSVAKTATGAAGSAGSAGSSVAGAASSAAAWVSAAASIAGGVISALGSARLEGTMNAVEANTRFTYIEIKDMMDTHLSQLIWYSSQLLQSSTWINMAIDQTNGILTARGVSFTPDLTNRVSSTVAQTSANTAPSSNAADGPPLVVHVVLDSNIVATAVVPKLYTLARNNGARIVGTR